MIDKARRPVTIKFERVTMDITFTDVLSDPRKLPWFMQYLLETHGVEEAVHEQAKLMLWLECEQYLDNCLSIPDGDFQPQAYQILKKFFLPDSNFSVLLFVPEIIRQKMLLLLSSFESHLKLDLNINAVFHETQVWIESDMRQGSFAGFVDSASVQKMKGHLSYSPPFVKFDLHSILSCEVKTMFLLIYLCQIKRYALHFFVHIVIVFRHSILYCCKMLQNLPEIAYDDSMHAVQELYRKALGCVHVLGLQQTHNGIVDLSMLSKLVDLLPDALEIPSILMGAPPSLTGTLADTYYDALTAAVNLSLPNLEHSVNIQPIRQCLQELRITILKELTTEIMPKFLESKEYEILLWELHAHREYLAQHQNDDNEGDDINVSNSVDSMELSDDVSIPDGAIQRLLRKVQLPSGITLHRVPLDLFDDLTRERQEQEENLCMAYLVLYDTIGPRIEGSCTGDKVRKSIEEEIAIQYILPITHTNDMISYTDNMVPPSFNNFIVPNSKYVHDTRPKNRMFNMVMSTRNNQLLYGCNLIMYRECRYAKDIKLQQVVNMAPATPAPTQPVEMVTPMPRNASSGDVSDTSKALSTPAPMPTQVTFATPPSQPINSITTPMDDRDIPTDTPHEAEGALPSATPITPTTRTPRVMENITIPKPAPSLPSAFKSLAYDTPITPRNNWMAQMTSSISNIESSLKNKSTPLLERIKGISLAGTINTPTAKSKHHMSNGVDGIATTSAAMSTPMRDNAVKTEANATTTAYVPHGFCLLTTTPCVNALRSAISKIVNSNSRMEALQCLYDDFEDETDEINNLRQAMLLASFIAEDESLSLLWRNSRRPIKVPSVMRCVSAYDMDIDTVIRSINPRNFVTVFVAFLLEYKIAIVSSKLTAITILGEILKTIIAPLKYCHVYAPVLPKKLANELLQCPTPYFVGIQRESFDQTSLPSDVFVLDIDSDTSRITPELSKALSVGRRLARAIDRVMRPALHTCDDVMDTPETHTCLHDVIRICKTFMYDLLVGVEECCISVVDHNELVVMFDEAMFSNYKNKHARDSLFPYDKSFLEHFYRSQGFSTCVAGNFLQKMSPDSRPPSRPSSPYVSIPPPQSFANAPPSTPTQTS